MFPFKKLRKEKRSEYRVDTRGRGQLVLGSDSGPIEATILDISAHGCGIRLQSADATKLQSGESVPLRIRLGGDDTPQLFLRGRLRGVTQEGRGIVRVGVKFVDVERLFPQLRDEQWRYFNRRAAYRVPPTDPAEEPLLARVRVENSPADAELCILNLSDSGIAVRGNDDHAGIEFGTAARAEFQLPGRNDAFEFGLRCVHRTLRSNMLRIGFRLETDATPDAESQQEEIGDWVVERQRELLARV